jgi:hypothetical protein
MPIDVRCECGHELSVADEMAGRKGRCPTCDTVIEIPAPKGAPKPPPARPSPAAAPAAPAYRLTNGLAAVLGYLAFLSLLLFASVGVYTGVTAFRGPEHFRGPLGLFAEFGEQVEANRWVVGAGFILVGSALGALSFVLFTAAGQILRITLSIERSLGDIARRLAADD